MRLTGKMPSEIIVTDRQVNKYSVIFCKYHRDLERSDSSTSGRGVPLSLVFMRFFIEGENAPDVLRYVLGQKDSFYRRESEGKRRREMPG